MQSTDFRGFRLSPQQRRLWALSEADRGNAYRSVCLVRVQAGRSPEAVREALARAVLRHEILRTTFRCPPGMRWPLQVIQAELPCPFEALDLSAAEPAEREAELERLFERARSEPFDPETGPLVRAWLASLGSEGNRLVLAASCLCLDAAGLERLAREVADEPEGEGEPLQYADLAEWQIEALSSEDSAPGRDFWRRQGVEAPSEALLPGTRALSVQEPFAPRIVALPLDPSLAAAVAAGEPSSEAWLAAAWQTLLSRLTGSPELVIGVHADGRDYEELQDALGLFARVVPLRLRAEPETAFATVVEAVDEALGKARTWQECFAWDGDEPRFCAFAFELAEAGEAIRQCSCVDRFQVKLLCRWGGGLVETELHFDPLSLDGDGATRLLERLHVLLESAVRSPQSPVGELGLLGPRERQQLLVQGVSGGSASRGIPVHRQMEQWAHLRPEAPALRCGEELLSYGELNARARRLAHRLRALGAGPEIAVAILLERSVEAIVAILGALQAGGAYVPLEPGQPPGRVSSMLEQSRAPLLLTSPDLAAGLSGTLPERVRIVLVEPGPAEGPGEGEEELAGGAEAGNPAYIIFTSGSTGAPKGVAVEHRNLSAYVAGALERLDLPPGASFAAISTLAADLGHTALFPALCSGGCLHLLRREESTDAAALSSRFEREPVDCLKIVPSHLEALLQGSRPEAVLPRRRLVLGGEACRWDLIEKIRSLAPPSCRILNHYGPTESTVGVLTHEISGEARRPGPTVPLGRPLPGARVYVLDVRQELAPLGAVGELYAGGEGVSRGYAGRPDLTAERFVPDPFSPEPGGRLYRTGDLARWTPEGDLEFLGRSDHQVKIRGYRIELGEIEEVLREHASVAQAVVTARPEPSGSARLVGYLVGREAAADGLADHLRRKLPDYMVPSALVWLAALPLTSNGKLDRNALPEPEAVRGARAWVAPRNRGEEILAGIWEEVLKVERVGVYDNFFDLGGDSILSIQIIARAGRFGLRLTPKQVFQHQTVAGLVAVAGREDGVVREQGPVTGAVPLTPIQRRFFELELPDPDHYNQAVLLALDETVRPEALASALPWLPRQHDALRLRFVREGTGWRQEHAGEPSAAETALPRLDLTALPAPARTAALTAAAAQVQAGLDLARGPVWRAALFDLGEPAGRRLLLVAHHLVVDVVSWRVLLEDLKAVAGDLERGAIPFLPPKTTSFKLWAERLEEHARSPEALAEVPYWATHLGSPFLRLPLDDPEGVNAEISAAALTVELDEEETTAVLRELPAAFRTRMNDVLLTALAGALAPWLGEGVLPVDLEGHGREDLFADVDLTRTVGWLTTLYPVFLALTPAEGAGETLARVRETLSRIPSRGFGYGVLRYLGEGEAAELCALPAAEIRFNYLGRLDEMLDEKVVLRPARESAGPSRGRRGRRSYVLDLLASVAHGRLRIQWSYSRSLHRRATVERLAERFRDVLRSLVAEARSPRAAVPSLLDFPLARLSQEQLARILEKAGQEQEQA